MDKKMFGKVRKGIASTIVASLLIFSQTAVSEAAVVSKKVETSPQIKILNNNVQVSGNVGPIVIDGTTYLPVRSLSNVLNKNVRWDGPTKSIFITDTVDPNESKNEIYNLEKFIKTQEAKITDFESSIKSKDTKITELENSSKSKDAKILELENAIKAKDARIAELEKKSSTSLKDLQNQLNKDYDDWSDLAFDITLKGDKDDIDVEIEIDLGKNSYYKEWNALSDSTVKKFITYIVEDIWDEYEDAEITGEVIDIDEDDTLVTFSGKDEKLEKFKRY
ncbi:stalk domain-containing protein [Solibacillus sp. MA9]|uniref:Stalk domain-containing protein n=1 Tax=Solibacillus palustris TaxID=2908203 RepID=A0ABS9U8F0_9BACL|nr:stalk domain-containing protein [Solibacillus sp. MA9]MCH7320597.1 stalk domain-containing protein [Solibacillus sp. MA9]